MNYLPTSLRDTSWIKQLTRCQSQNPSIFPLLFWAPSFPSPFERPRGRQTPQSRRSLGLQDPWALRAVPEDEGQIQRIRVTNLGYRRSLAEAREGWLGHESCWLEKRYDNIRRFSEHPREPNWTVCKASGEPPGDRVFLITWVHSDIHGIQAGHELSMQSWLQ